VRLPAGGGCLCVLAGLCVLAPTAAARPAPPDLCLLARRLRVGGGGLGVVPTCKAQPARLVVRRPLGCIWQCDGGALRTHEGRRGGPPRPPGGPAARPLVGGGPRGPPRSAQRCADPLTSGDVAPCATTGDMNVLGLEPKTL